MGNRFRDLDGYYTLILAHGVIATVVFLGFVPAAIMMVRYYSIYDRYWAYKYHVWLQILTLLLSTVVFLLVIIRSELIGLPPFHARWPFQSLVRDVSGEVLQVVIRRQCQVCLRRCE